MNRALVLSVAAVSVALSACESSRFSSSPYGSSRYQSQAALQPARQVPIGDDLVDGGRGLGAGAVTSTPLDAPPGASAQIPVQSQPIPPAAPIASAPTVAAVAPPASPAPRTANTLSGTWTLTDAGASCRMTLSSQSLFDLYRASPQGCQSPSLAKVNAWKQNGSELTLYEPGGKVAARLFQQGNAYSGATARGANISMSR